jgi:hypothetical protein
MRITQPREGIFSNWQVAQALQALLQAPLPHVQPPCPGCCNHRPALCSALCPDAARACSSEPQRHPVEPAVLPLVYELNALRVFQSCWSCEGHLGRDGRLWKRPQVSFYAGSSIYAMVLASYLHSLYQLKRLTYCWQITFADFGRAPCPTYCIEPRLEGDRDVHLGKLQADLREMSQDLGQAIRLRASEYLKDSEPE